MIAAVLSAGAVCADSGDMVKIVSSGGVETEYPTLTEAVPALQDGDTLVLLCDYSMGPRESLAIGTAEKKLSVVLDMGGFTLSLPEASCFKEDYFGVANGSRMSVCNGSLVVCSDIEFGKWTDANYGMMVKGQLELSNGVSLIRNGCESGCFDVYPGGELTIRSGVIVQSCCDSFRLQDDGVLRGTATVNLYDGCVINANGSGAYAMFYIANPDSVFDVNIYGGALYSTEAGFCSVFSACVSSSSFSKSVGAGCQASFDTDKNTDLFLADGYEMVYESGAYRVRSTSGGQPSWDDAGSVAAGAKAGEVWTTCPAALVNADAKKLASWAKGLSIGFSDVGSINPEAFLLNCANTPEAVAAAKAAFVIPSVTVVDGKVSVGEPTGTYNGTVSIFGATALDGGYDDTKGVFTGKRFFKAVLGF